MSRLRHCNRSRASLRRFHATIGSNICPERGSGCSVWRKSWTRGTFSCCCRGHHSQRSRHVCMNLPASNSPCHAQFFPADRTGTATHQSSCGHIAFHSARVHSLLASRTHGISRPLVSKPSRGEPLRALRAVRVRGKRKGICRAARQTTASRTFRRPAAPVQAAALRQRTQRLVAHPAFTVRPAPADFPVWGRWRFEPKLQQTSLFLL